MFTCSASQVTLGRWKVQCGAHTAWRKYHAGSHRTPQVEVEQPSEAADDQNVWQLKMSFGWGGARLSHGNCWMAAAPHSLYKYTYI